MKALKCKYNLGPPLFWWFLSSLLLKSLTRPTGVCSFPYLALRTLPIPLLSLLSSPEFSVCSMYILYIYIHTHIYIYTFIKLPPSKAYVCLRVWSQKDLILMYTHSSFKSLPSLLFITKFKCYFLARIWNYLW